MAQQSGNYWIVSDISYAEDGTWRNLRLEAPFTATASAVPQPMPMPGVTSPENVGQNETYPMESDPFAMPPGGVLPDGVSPRETQPDNSTPGSGFPGDMQQDGFNHALYPNLRE
jgi:hypothetical protein